MKVSLSQLVEFEGDKCPYYWKKTYESTTVPHKGDFVGDPLWKDPYEYEVMEVIVYYYNDTCFVGLAPYSLVLPKERMADFKQMAQLHGWEAGWMLLE